MPTVLFVCTANICRSPVAEVLFRRWLQLHAIPGEWRVGSAGTWTMPGASASFNSQQVAAARGLDLSRHRSRQVDEDLLAETDVALCMTRGHVEALQVEFPEYAHRVHLWTALAGPGYDVADPYGGPLPGYETMAREFEYLVQATGERIVGLARTREAGTP
jgi:protein-tyrosine phosphatase